MPNSLKSRKAQFFILSAFAIITAIYFISKWIEPYTIIDTSSVALMEEPFIFNNIVEKADQTVLISKSAEDLNYNLEEYKSFVLSYVLSKGYSLSFDYDFYPVISNIPGGVAFNCIQLKSPTATFANMHSLKWP